ncbi:MAG: response regulator [Verrucomicrobia bacterium]|nr:response regulator [Verrucomicrobiota bacterium]
MKKVEDTFHLKTTEIIPPPGDDAKSPPVPSVKHPPNFKRNAEDNAPVVLVVDDDDVTCRIVRSHLEKLGIAVVTAADAAEAIAMMTARGLSRFDCVVTDYLMPDKNGVELARWIKQQDENISIVMLTRMDDKDVVKQSLRVGATDFVEKPVRPAHLADVIQTAIQQTIKRRKRRTGRYILGPRIGGGGLGEVYQAWDNELSRSVALKYPHHPKTLAGGDPAVLFGEAIRLARLQHPNIVNVFDCGVDAKGPFIVMELLHGQTLDEAVESSPSWPVLKISQLADQCLDALVAAHQLNLIHLDIKPANIMLLDLPGGSFHAKILDFGLSQFIHTSISSSADGEKSIYGTPLYAAPEIYHREAVDHRTDLYALGCSLYLAAAKKDAFSALSVQAVYERHLNHDVIDLYRLRPDLGMGFCSWMMRLMEPDPANRPPTALAAKESLAEQISKET